MHFSTTLLSLHFLSPFLLSKTHTLSVSPPLMSFLNLRRLLPPRKVWKVFTKKLQIKLHKLNRSKAIKKPKIQSYETSKRLGWPSLSIRPKKFKLKPKPHTLIHLQKRTPSVYVDQLFIEPVSTVKERLHPPPAAFEEEEANKDKSSSSGNLKRTETGNEGTIAVCDHKSNAADDMWESMVLTSPQTQGINERAEEFIARFRAQMHHQEMLARSL
ncbi:hypothetical protein Pfo_006438 [Paulownia fortunei]|nr:hypothetical protein Pfo_006438 [Paulownia fortunei]